VNEAELRLDAVLAEQVRASERFDRSIGTTAELSAYLDLRASTRAVQGCEQWQAVTVPASRASGRFVFSLLCESSAPSAARAEIARRLDGLVDGDAMATILLLASETVTNAVKHGAARTVETVDVEADLSAERLWVGVTNAGPACDHVPVAPATHEPGGRGLFLVEEMSSAWGTGHADGATSVWFEVDRRTPAAAGAGPAAATA
jgi:anti-sigma regulatory factor (Ser/Thr protein kinase)